MRKLLLVFMLACVTTQAQWNYSGWSGGKTVARMFAISYGNKDSLRIGFKYSDSLDMIIDFGWARLTQNGQAGGGNFSILSFNTASNINAAPKSNIDRDVTLVKSVATDLTGPYAQYYGTGRWIGGAHGHEDYLFTSNPALHLPTLRHDSLKVLFDGCEPDSGIIYSVDSVLVTAYHTIYHYQSIQDLGVPNGTDFISEVVQWHLRDNSINIDLKSTFLDTGNVAVYYGLQWSNLVLWDSTVHFWNGDLHGNEMFGMDSSGHHAEYPDVWGCDFSGKNLYPQDKALMFVDTSYGSVKGWSYHYDNFDNFISSASKTYLNLKIGEITDFDAGDTLAWRGGWALFNNNNDFITGENTGVIYNDLTGYKIWVSYLKAGSDTLILPSYLSGYLAGNFMTSDSINVTQSGDSLFFNAVGYGVSSYKLDH